MDSAPAQQLAKPVGFCIGLKSLKTDGGHGAFEEYLQRGISEAGAVQQTSASDMSGDQGADLLRRGFMLKQQISRFAKMILRDRCSTSYDVEWQAQYFRWDGKIANRNGTEAAAALPMFHFCRKMLRF